MFHVRLHPLSRHNSNFPRMCKRKKALALSDMLMYGCRMDTKHHLTTARQVVEFIGKDKVMSGLGIAKRRLDECCQKNQFSALHYDALERMAGRALPREMFSFAKVAE
jgi:hypothetical protein